MYIRLLRAWNVMVEVEELIDSSLGQSDVYLGKYFPCSN
jgi:hypothetical protein